MPANRCDHVRDSEIRRLLKMGLRATHIAEYLCVSPDLIYKRVERAGLSYSKEVDVAQRARADRESQRGAEMVRAALTASGWNAAAAARELGVPDWQLHYPGSRLRDGVALRDLAARIRALPAPNAGQGRYRRTSALILAKAPDVFRASDVEALGLNKHTGAGSRAIHRLLKAGLVERIARGLYRRTAKARAA